jgi:hypothetical protein
VPFEERLAAGDDVAVGGDEDDLVGHRRIEGLEVAGGDRLQVPGEVLAERRLRLDALRQRSAGWFCRLHGGQRCPRAPTAKHRRIEGFGHPGPGNWLVKKKEGGAWRRPDPANSKA